MAYSYQSEVSDGTLQRVILSIPFYNKEDIRVSIDGRELSEADGEYSWEGDVAVYLRDVVPAGQTCMLKRNTDMSKLRLKFSEGVAFTRNNLDDQNSQFLHMGQEAKESAISDVYNDIDMHHFRIHNAGDPEKDLDYTTKRWVEKTYSEAVEFCAASAIEASTSAASAVHSAADATSSAEDALISAMRAEAAAGAVGPQVKEALRRSYAEVGFNLVSGSFEDGAIITNHQEVLLQGSTGKGFNWQGPIPVGGKVIPVGSTPESTGGIGADKWQDVTNTTQHSQTQYSGGVDYKTYYAWQGDVKLQHKDEAVQFKHGGLFYRWDGVFPQGGLVIPHNTPEPSQWQTGTGKYIAVLDLAIKDAYAQPNGSSYIGFIQASLKSIARTVQDRLRETVSVKDFGAKGNLLADDTEAIRSAINYALTVGGRVFLPAGYYRVTGPLNIGLPFYVNNNDVSFIVNRTAPISDPEDIAKQDAANKAANESKKRIDFRGEADTYIVTDYIPQVYTPAVSYNLDNDSYDNTGAMSNFSVVHISQISGGVYNPNAKYTPNKIVGVYAGRGCSVSEKLFYAGLGGGFLTNRAYWTTSRDMKANKCGIGFNLSAHNQAVASGMNAHTCLTGFVYDGQAAELSTFGSENCDTDIAILSADCCTFGPAYLEDVRTTGGAGAYSVQLGYDPDRLQITHCTFNNILCLNVLGTAKKGFRFWSVAKSVFQSCRTYGSGYSIDTNSYGRAISCDFTVSGAHWRGDFDKLLVDDTEQANSSIATFNGTGVTQVYFGSGNSTITTVDSGKGRGGAMCVIRGTEYGTGTAFCRVYAVRIQASRGSGGVAASTPLKAGGEGINFTFSDQDGKVGIKAEGLVSGGEWSVSFFGM